MGDNSGIQWTDATWNPLVGCTVVSPGCTNCYAMKEAARMARMGQAKYAGLTKDSRAGPVWTGKLHLHEPALAQPTKWRRPRHIFVNSMGDLFHEDAPLEWIDQVFGAMALCPQHRFQVLTKRAERMRVYTDSRLSDVAQRVWGAADRLACKLNLPEHHPSFDYLCAGKARAPWPLPQVWLGVSAEDQARFDLRVEHLAATLAAKRFVSCEPLLGSIDVGNALDDAVPDGSPYRPIDWVIVGGESGDQARPMKLNWARELVMQCRVWSVPIFVKQLGSWPIHNGGSRYPTRDRKGGNPEHWPADLRVREMP